MNRMTRDDLTVLMHSMLEDAVREAILGNYSTARLLQAYAEDVLEIVQSGGENSDQD